MTTSIIIVANPETFFANHLHGFAENNKKSLCKTPEVMFAIRSFPPFRNPTCSGLMLCTVADCWIVSLMMTVFEANTNPYSIGAILVLRRD
jgi:hypothetical protein